MTISKTAISKAKPRQVLRDTHIIGLELYVGATTKTWRVHYRTRADKRERRLRLGSYPTLNLKQAREVAREVLVEVARGEDPAFKQQTPKLERVYYEYIDAMSGKLKPKTLECYESSWRTVLKPLGGLPLTDVKRAAVDKLLRGAKGYAGNRALALLSRLYTYAQSLDYIEAAVNPTTGVQRNKERPRSRYATPDELQSIGGVIEKWRLSEQYRKRQFADILSLIILTGARLNEIVSSRCDWYDLDRGRLCLPDSKTGAKDIFIPSAAAPIIRRNSGSGRVYLFQHATLEEPIKGVDKLWLAAKEQAGIDDLRMHDLRRSYATYANSSGVEMSHIASLLGHSSVKTTERSYAFLKDDVKSAQMERVSRIMAEQLKI